MLAGVLPPLGDRPRGSRAGVVPLHPTPRHRARGRSEDMRLGCKVTAARRQASRLAGLVRLPAGCIAKTAIRRQASWLATKASVKSKSRWPFALQNIQTALKHSTLQGVSMPTADCGARKSAYSSAPQNFQATPKHPNPQGDKPDPTPTGKRNPVRLPAPQNQRATSKHPNPQGVSMPTANCGGAERR